MLKGRLGLNENYNEIYLKKIKKRLKNNLKNYITYYPDANASETKRLLAQKFDLSSDNFFISNGSDEILLSIACIFSNTKCIVTTKNTFCSYKSLAKLFDKKLKEVEFTNFQLNANKFIKNIEENSLIFLPNPTNPLGTFVNKDDMLKILEKAKETNSIFVVDEAYAEFAEREYPSNYQSMNKYLCDNLIVTRTFSKFYGLAGIRCGYAISSKNNIEKLKGIKSVLVYSINSIAMQASNVLLELESEKINNKIFNKVKKLKDDFYNFCDNNHIEYIKSATNFIVVKVNNADQVFTELQNLKISIKSCSVFGFNDYIRVTITNKKDLNKIKTYLLEKNNEVL